MDTSFHYPPELLKLLTDTIPKLCKGKRDLLLFFQGAGFEKEMLKPYELLLKKERDSISKYEITSELLTKINESGDKSLRTRREVLKRVTEFEDFTLCWPGDQAPARGLVAQIRALVNRKDSFTRMNIEREEEKRKHIDEQEAAKKKHLLSIEKQKKVKQDLYNLFSEQDAQKRGKLLEAVLNELFKCYEISIREAFTIKGNCDEGIIEQIDGLVELDGHLYLVEMKWWNSNLGVNEIAPHLVRLHGRGRQVRGLFISYTDFTAPAITECRSALAGGAVLILATLEELVLLLDRGGDLKVWLRKKTEAALVHKNPLHKIM